MVRKEKSGVILDTFYTNNTDVHLRKCSKKHFALTIFIDFFGGGLAFCCRKLGYNEFHNARLSAEDLAEDGPDSGQGFDPSASDRLNCW